jgi:hypothetical protein
MDVGKEVAEFIKGKGRHHKKQWWLTPVILLTQEAEIGMIGV